jgi:hypothetical protein
MGAAGPPAGRVGSLIVGEELGLGGRLMRTVSFLGWTFAASAGRGGTAPPGVIGLLSAISMFDEAKLGSAQVRVKLFRDWPPVRSWPARSDWERECLSRGGSGLRG